MGVLKDIFSHGEIKDGVYVDFLLETEDTVAEAFCPTGEGGGVRNDCSSREPGDSGDQDTASYRSSQSKSPARKSARHDATGPITANVKQPEEIQKWKSRLGIQDADEDAVHRTSGAVHGSTVSVMPGRGGLHMEVDDDRYRAVSALTRDRQGVLQIENFHFNVYKPYRGRGLGTEIFRTQVDAARTVGAQKIVVHSIGDWKRRDTHNGYYTWPRLGFDGDLPENWKERMSANGLKVIPAKLENAKRVSDLFRLKDGRHLWKRFGFPMSLEFDVNKGSLSRRVFDAYYDSEDRVRSVLKSEASDKQSSRRESLRNVLAVLGESYVRDSGGNSFDLGLDDDEAAFEKAWDALGKSPLAAEAFCPTGKGGGIKNECSSRDGSGDSDSSESKTKSPAFRRWFGDSKVVSGKGEPLVLYHGTPKPGFGEFKSQSFPHTAGYFSEDHELANLSVGDPESGGVYPVYLSIKKPMDLTGIPGGQNLTVDQFLENVPFAVTPEERNQIIQDASIRGTAKENPSWSWLGLKPFSDAAKKRGYDGIVYNELNSDEANRTELERQEKYRERGRKYEPRLLKTGRSWVAFSADQIKSAIGNKGTFNPNSNKIGEAYCATGKDGGVDNSCSSHGDSSETPSSSGERKSSRRESIKAEIMDRAGKIKFKESDWDGRDIPGQEAADGDWKLIQGGGDFNFTTSSGGKYHIKVDSTFNFGMEIHDLVFTDHSGGMDITGSGGAHEVFGQVVPAVVAFMKNKDAPAVMFQAKEPSRRKLYDKLAKTTAAVMPGYSALALNDQGPYKTYVVVKREHKDDVLGRIEDRGESEVLVECDLSSSISSWYRPLFESAGRY